MGIAIVDSGTPALVCAPVVTNATPASEAIEGCMVMVVLVVTVGTPTVTGMVNGHPGTGSCSISREGTLRNSKSSDDGPSSRQAGIPAGVSDTNIFWGGAVPPSQSQPPRRSTSGTLFRWIGHLPF